MHSTLPAGQLGWLSGHWVNTDQSLKILTSYLKDKSKVRGDF